MKQKKTTEEGLAVRIVKLRRDAATPVYQTDLSAGMDLHACIDMPVVLDPLERVLIPTGISIELPDGYEAQIRARSGLALNHGITIANGIGTIDADYRGEIGVLLINLGKEPFTVEIGMRIAQMVVARHEHVVWYKAGRLVETERGTDGFGSTGV